MGILVERRQEGPGKEIMVRILPRAYNRSADERRILDCRYPKQLNPPFGLRSLITSAACLLLVMFSAYSAQAVLLGLCVFRRGVSSERTSTMRADGQPVKLRRLGERFQSASAPLIRVWITQGQQRRGADHAHTNRQMMLPSGPQSMWNTSPAQAGTVQVNEPPSTT
jgi:hypothetical protein